MYSSWEASSGPSDQPIYRGRSSHSWRADATKGITPGYLPTQTWGHSGGGLVMAVGDSTSGLSYRDSPG